jgi:hypothetical protein
VIRRFIVLARVGALTATVSLGFAGVVAAYKIPGVPAGTPGGPPTKPTTTNAGPGSTKGAGTATANTAKALGTSLAGLTNLELADQGTFTITVHFPTGGTMVAHVSTNGKSIGTGVAGRNNKGTGPLGMNFSSSGRSLLRSNVGKSLTLLIKMTFVPKGGSKDTVSQVTLKTVG